MLHQSYSNTLDCEKKEKKFVMYIAGLEIILNVT